MSIYDDYAASNVCQVEDESNHNNKTHTKDQTTTHAARHPNHALSGALSYDKDDIDNLTVVIRTRSDVTVHDNPVRDEQNNPSSTTSTSSHRDVMESEMTENDGPPSALSPMSTLNNDMTKKRPLSISSTSSATSTSSLPRPERKKLAGNDNPTSALAYNNNGGGFNNSDDTTMTSCSSLMTSPIMTSHAGVVTSEVCIMDTLTDEDEEEDEDYTQCRLRNGSGISTLSDNKEGFNNAERMAGCHAGTQMSYIDKVVAEILETERTYVTNLEEIIKGYLYEFRSSAATCIDQPSVDALFSNIEEIHDFNKLFLGQLESCRQDAVRLAQCFVDNNEGFVIYSDYCTHYPAAVEVLTSVMGEEEKAEAVKSRQQALGHTLPLGAYLLKPVQRILKYHLLLQNILSHMPPGGGDRQVVEEALSSMTRMAQHINEMKRKHEHAVRIQELHALLCEWDGGKDFNKYGDLVKEETFKMHGAKGDRHLILFARGLLIAKRKEDSGLQIKDSIMCSNLMLVERIPKEPLSFHVIPFDNPRGQHTFQAKCLEQKREWCRELKRLILESYTADKAIPKNVIELVMQLTSKDEQDLKEGNSSFSSSAQTRKPCPKPKYIERKKRRKSVTAILPDLTSTIKTHVTKRVLTRRSEGSPRPSPRVHRRRSDSSVPREAMRHLMEKQKKRELLCEGDDNSDTDSTDRVPYGSLESIHSEDQTPEPGVHHHSQPSGTPSSLNQTIEPPSSPEAGMESGLDSTESTPTRTPIRLRWPPPGYQSTPEVPPQYSPCTPVRRRENFRITSNPLQSSSNKQGMVSHSGLHLIRDAKMRYLLRSRRRVSESDLCLMADEQEEGGEVDMSRYTSLGATALIGGNGEEGDDECDNEEGLIMKTSIGSPNGKSTTVPNREGHCSLIDGTTSKTSHGTSPFCLRNDHSPSLNRTVSGGKSDPWIPQSRSQERKKVNRLPKRHLRSNSMSSISDLLDDPSYQNGSEQLVFSNRNAFVSSQNPHTIRHSHEAEQAIARLATPPREFGPPDVIQTIKDSREHGRIVTRYATPPRNLLDPSAMMSSSSATISPDQRGCLYAGVYSPEPINTQGLPARRTLPGDMRYSGPGFWTDFEDYLSSTRLDMTGSVPKFPVSSPGFSDYLGQRASPPGTISSSHSSSIQSPSSPSSVTSNDSLVETLKQKVFNLTSLIASHLPRGSESSPRRPASRSNSFGALEELRVKQAIPSSSSASKSGSQKKEKRGRFVSSLARVYSDRQKRSGPMVEKRDPSVDKENSEKSKELACLLNEGQPGSNVIGERMAASKPIVLGTYTLPRHRNLKSKKSVSSDDKKAPTTVAPEDANQQVVRRRGSTQKSELESTDSSGYDSGVKDLALEGDGIDIEQSLETTLAAFNQAFSGFETSRLETAIDDDSMYFYEKRFVEDLESNFGSDIFRDSAVYSDDGSPMTETAEALSPNVSIKETVKLIEQRSLLKALPKTEIKEEEKGKGIKKIMKNLEAGGGPNISNIKQCGDVEQGGSASDRASMKTVRDRTRELIECATLARIRQDACQVVEDWSPEDEAEAMEAGRTTPPLRRGRSRSRRWKSSLKA